MPSRRFGINLFRFLQSGGKPPPDMSWVTPTLAVGGFFEQSQVPLLVEMGVGAIVDLREEDCDDAELLAQYGIDFLHMPTRDHHAPDSDELGRTLDWVLDRLGEGKKVYVHCHEGIGRSVTLACALLIRMGYCRDDAIRLVRAKRWGASPTSSQWRFLGKFEEEVRKRRG